MTRYLTPSKIGLVVLVKIYCSKVNVPDDAIVPVLSFVLSHLIPPSPRGATHGKTDLDTTRGVLTTSTFEAVLRPHQSSRPGRSLYDVFVNELRTVDSLNALHEFFAELEQYLQYPEVVEFGPEEGMLARTSPLGIFFRRVSLEFTRLQFNDAAKLWAGFARFRAPTEASWRKKNHVSVVGPSFDLAISEFDVVQPNRLAQAAYGAVDANELEEMAPSTDDISRLLDFDLSKLQGLGGRVPQTLQAGIKAMISTNPNSTPHTAHLASFFDCWRGGDFTGSIENLHRYFDYTVRNRDKTLYQYALLHMAILQADFGCFDEAVASMNEAISTARENGDVECLDFSLGWLGHLAKAHPNDLKKAGYAGMLGPEKERLTFLGDKSREHKNWQGLSSTLLSEATLALSVGGDLAYISEKLLQSAHLNFVHHEVINCGVQLLVEAAFYARIGLNTIADNDCEIVLDCYNGLAPIEDVVRARCRLAQGANQVGQYTRAKAILEGFDPEIYRTLRQNAYIHTHTSLLHLKHLLRQHDLTAAEHVLHALQASAPPEPDLQFQIELLEIQYHIARKNLSRAADKIEVMITAKGESDVVRSITLLLAKAEVFAKGGNAGKGFTVVMRAAALAWRWRVLPLMWEAMGSLARVLSFFGEDEHASKLMDAILPQALGAGATDVSAILYSRQADACMGLAGKAEPKSRQQASLLSKTEGYVDKAIALYEKLQDLRGHCEMLAKRAVIARMRGDLKLAEDWATKYLTLYDRQFGRKGGDVA